MASKSKARTRTRVLLLAATAAVLLLAGGAAAQAAASGDDAAAPPPKRASVAAPADDAAPAAPVPRRAAAAPAEDAAAVPAAATTTATTNSPAAGASAAAAVPVSAVADAAGVAPDADQSAQSLRPRSKLADKTDPKAKEWGDDGLPLVDRYAAGKLLNDIKYSAGSRTTCEMVLQGEFFVLMRNWFLSIFSVPMIFFFFFRVEGGRGMARLVFFSPSARLAFFFLKKLDIASTLTVSFSFDSLPQMTHRHHFTMIEHIFGESKL